MSDFLSFFPEVEQQYGLPTGYLERVAQVESRMDPTAQNPNSSAGGLFQFIDSTARQYNLADRFDPRQATDAAARLARDNAATLRNVLGRDPTAGELYLAHQQGAGGAARLLRNPDAPAVGVLGNEAFRLNGGRQGMTAAQFAQRWIGKIDGQPARDPTQGPPRGVNLPNITPQDAETWAEAPPQAMGYAPANLAGMPRGPASPSAPSSAPSFASPSTMLASTGPQGLPASPLAQSMPAPRPRPDTFTGGTTMSEMTAEKPVPASVGGLGGLGGFQPIAGGKFGDMLQMIGMALLSSPGNAPLQNLPALAMTMQKSRTDAEERAWQRQRDERDYALRARGVDIQERGLNRRERVPLTPIKDAAGNIVGTFNPVTGEQRPVGAAGQPSGGSPSSPAMPQPLQMPQASPSAGVMGPAAPPLTSPGALPQLGPQPSQLTPPTAPSVASPPPPQVNAFGVPVIQGIRTLTDPAERARYGIPPEDKRVYQVDGAGKVTSPGGQSININSGERSYEQERGKQDATMFGEIQTAGRNAGNTIGTLNMMERLTRDPNFYSGTGAQTALRLKQFGEALGIGQAGASTPMEFFQALSNRGILDASGGSLGAQISNADRDFIASTFPNLANTPEGNRQMIGYYRKLAERQQQVARMAREYAARNNGRIDPKFADEIAKYAEENPIFPRAEGQQGQPQQQGASQQQGIREGATATNPQTGQRIQFKNGQWVPVQ